MPPFKIGRGLTNGAIGRTNTPSRWPRQLTDESYHRDTHVPHSELPKAHNARRRPSALREIAGRYRTRPSSKVTNLPEPVTPEITEGMPRPKVFHLDAPASRRKASQGLAVPRCLSPRVRVPLCVKHSPPMKIAHHVSVAPFAVRPVIKVIIPHPVPVGLVPEHATEQVRRHDRLIPLAKLAHRSNLRCTVGRPVSIYPRMGMSHSCCA